MIDEIPFEDAGLNYNLPMNQTCVFHPNSAFFAFDYSAYSSHNTGYEILNDPNKGYTIINRVDSTVKNCYASKLTIETLNKTTCSVIFVPFLGSDGTALSDYLPTLQEFIVPRQAGSDDLQHYLSYSEMISNCIEGGFFDLVSEDLGSGAYRAESSFITEIILYSLIYLFVKNI